MSSLTTTTSSTFLDQQRGDARGGRFVARWWMTCPFRRSLEAAHRCVLDELYHALAHEPMTHSRTGRTVGRGEWIITYEQLARRAGATYEQTRRSVKKAEAAGMLQLHKIPFREPGRTRHLMHITWLNFDRYEWPDHDSAHDIAHDTTHNTAHDTAHNSAHPEEHSLENTQSSNTLEVNTRRDEEGAPPTASNPWAPAATDDAKGSITAEAPAEGIAPAQTPSPLPQAPKPRMRKSKASARRQTAEPPPGVLADAMAIAGYLLHGEAAVGKSPADWIGLPPGPNHWSPTTRDLNNPEPVAGPKQLAAWFWALAMLQRQNQGEPLYLPNWGRLGAAVKALISQRGRDQALRIIWILTTRWPEVRARISWMTDVQLSEATLANIKLIEAAIAVDRGDALPAATGKPGAGENTNEEWTY